MCMFMFRHSPVATCVCMYVNTIEMVETTLRRCPEKHRPLMIENLVSRLSTDLVINIKYSV